MSDFISMVLLAQVAPEWPELAPLRPAIELAVDNDSSLRWWVVFLLASLLLGAIFLFLYRKRKKPKEELSLSLEEGFENWKNTRSTEREDYLRLRQFFRAGLRLKYPDLSEEFLLSEMLDCADCDEKEKQAIERLDNELNQFSFGQQTLDATRYEEIVLQVEQLIKKGHFRE